MVKKIFYPLFAAAVLLFAESALAEQIDAQQARQQAMAFLNRNATTKKMLKGGNADLQLAYTAQSGEYYAFNASAADGYVLVSGDDRMPAVIGYSDEGKFDADAIPDNMREWLETYAEQVRYVQTHAGVHIQSSPTKPRLGMCIRCWAIPSGTRARHIIICAPRLATTAPPSVPLRAAWQRLWRK